MKFVLSYRAKSLPKPGVRAAIWLLVWLSAAFCAVVQVGQTQPETVRQEVVNSIGAGSVNLVIEAGEEAGFMGLALHAGSSKTHAVVFSSCGPGSIAALPQSGNPAEESEVKSGNECAGWLCYAARRGLPDAQPVCRLGREPGDDAQALPLYDMHCSWRAYPAQA